MTTVGEIYNFIDGIAPFSTAMDFDNCGLQIGSKDNEVKRVLLALDITAEVIDEAKEIKAELIVSHHPVIFKPLKKLDSDSMPCLIAKNDMNAICAHTNLDVAQGGVNDCLAKALSLSNLEPLDIYRNINYKKIVVFVPDNYTKAVLNSMFGAGAGVLGDYKNCSFISAGEGRFTPDGAANPFIGERGKFEVVLENRVEVLCDPDKVRDVVLAMKIAHPYEEPAFDIFETSSVKKEIPCGLVGEIEKSMICRDFAKFVKEKLGCKGLRYIENNRLIKKVAVCSGSGGSLISKVISSGADAYVTGEIKHNEILEAAANKVTVIDAGHFKTEDVVIEPLMKKLRINFPGVDFVKSSVFTDHINYL